MLIESEPCGLWGAKAKAFFQERIALELMAPPPPQPPAPPAPKVGILRTGLGLERERE